MGVAFVIHVFGVHSHNSASDPAGFRIPTYVISNFEYSCHGGFRAKLHPILRGSALVFPICSVRNIDRQTAGGLDCKRRLGPSIRPTSHLTPTPAHRP